MPNKSQQVRRQLKAAYGKTKPSPGSGTGDAEDRPSIEQVIADNAGLVRRVARRHSRVSGGALDLDDLISVGVMGLIQAWHNFDASTGKPFRSYAEFRVRGAILDELRRIDPMSQPRRRKVRKFERAINELAHELGRQPSEQELAQHLDVPLDELQKMRRELQQIRFVPADGGEIDDIRHDLAGSRMPRSQLRLVLTNAIEQLPPRDQQVLGLYYFHDMKLREIGEILGVTEARVCQLHKAAVGKLRVILDDSGATAR